MRLLALIRYWVPVLVWMCCIFVVSTDAFSAQNTALIIEPVIAFLIPDISPQTAALFHAFIRKLAHITEYFILGLLLFRALRSDSAKKHCIRWALLSLSLTVLYALTDEFHQSFTISRTASLGDVGIDTVGGVLAQVVNTIRYRSKVHL